MLRHSRRPPLGSDPFTICKLNQKSNWISKFIVNESTLKIIGLNKWLNKIKKDSQKTVKNKQQQFNSFTTQPPFLFFTGCKIYSDYWLLIPNERLKIKRWMPGLFFWLHEQNFNCYLIALLPPPWRDKINTNVKNLFSRSWWPAITG